MSDKTAYRMTISGSSPATSATNLPRLIPLLSVALCLATAAWAFLYSRSHPVCCDSVAYGQAAESMREVGVLGNFHTSSLRTYGFPLFVRIVTAGASSGAARDLLVALTHVSLFLAAAVYVARALGKVSPALPRYLWIGIVANPVIAVYLPYTLTEPLTVTFILLACGTAVHAERAVTLHACAAWIALGSLFVAFALVVRPASIALVAGWLAFLAFLLVKRARALRPALWLPVVAAGCLVAAAAAAVALAPQLYINSVHHGKMTVLPATQLGEFQARMGLQLIKYGTNLDQGPPQLNYLNPFFDGRAAPQQPLLWYLENPGLGLLTASLHVFNSINHDYLFVYIYDLTPGHQALVILFSQLLIWVGGAGVLFALGSWYRQRRRAAWPTGLGIVVLTTTAGVLAINAISAVESRFGVPVLLLLGPCTVWMVEKWWHQPPRLKLVGALLACLFVAGGYQLSEWVSQQAPSIVAARQANGG